MKDKLGRNARLKLEENGEHICRFEVTHEQAELVQKVATGIISHRADESGGRVRFEYACEKRAELQGLLDKVQDR